MQRTPLLQNVLKTDWNRLPPVIRQHYDITSGTRSCVRGKMEIGYPNYLRPLIILIHLCGGLIAQRGRQVDTQVIKTVDPKKDQLCWERIMHYPDRRLDRFQSRMAFLQDHELVEWVRFGFGLRLKLSVDHGELIYRSNGHIWQWGKFCLTFPDWLLLGSATIVEKAISDRQFSLDFEIRHPLWDVSYYYRGTFEICE